jgi:hypothetical protein
MNDFIMIEISLVIAKRGETAHLTTKGEDIFGKK